MLQLTGRLRLKAQCIKNLGNVLTAAGSSWEKGKRALGILAPCFFRSYFWEKVVKVNVYLKNMDNFSAMNEIYEKVR